MQNKEPNVLQRVNKAHHELVERNRRILMAIVEVIFLCGKQNISLHGHNIGDGNFEALLLFKAKDNNAWTGTSPWNLFG